MLWYPNTQHISSRHAQYINRSQLLITDLEPTEDNTLRRLCSAMLINPFTSSFLTLHPSLPICHLKLVNDTPPSSSSLISSPWLLPATLSQILFQFIFFPFMPFNTKGFYSIQRCLYTEWLQACQVKYVCAHFLSYNMRVTCGLLYINILIYPLKYPYAIQYVLGNWTLKLELKSI